LKNQQAGRLPSWRARPADVSAVHFFGTRHRRYSAKARRPLSSCWSGKQPGDQEDIAGHVFVGPSGKLLDRALAAVGVDRAEVYLTNAVKHFKNEPRGKRRLHKRPNRYEIDQCRWWIEHEIAIVQPKIILALGATAGGALTGRPVKVGKKPAAASIDMIGNRKPSDEFSRCATNGIALRRLLA